MYVIFSLCVCQNCYECIIEHDRILTESNKSSMVDVESTKRGSRLICVGWSTSFNGQAMTEPIYNRYYSVMRNVADSEYPLELG